MKILMLTWEYPPMIVGGLARHCKGLSEALARQGHEVYVLTLEFPGTPDEDVVEGVLRGGRYDAFEPEFDLEVGVRVYVVLAFGRVAVRRAGAACPHRHLPRVGHHLHHAPHLHVNLGER